MLFTGRNKPKEAGRRQSEQAKPKPDVNTQLPSEKVSMSRFTQPTNIQPLGNGSDNVRRIVTSSKHNIGMESKIQTSMRDDLQKKILDVENSHQDTIRKLENKIMNCKGLSEVCMYYYMVLDQKARKLLSNRKVQEIRNDN